MLCCGSSALRVSKAPRRSVNLLRAYPKYAWRPEPRPDSLRACAVRARVHDNRARQRASAVELMPLAIGSTRGTDAPALQTGSDRRPAREAARRGVDGPALAVACVHRDDRGLRGRADRVRVLG